MSERPRAVITGLGAVSSLGIGVEALWRGLLAGTQAVRRYPALAAVGLDIGPIGRVFLPGEEDDAVGSALLGGTPRATAMAELAASEALRDAGLLTRAPATRLGISVGTTLGEKAPWVQGIRQIAGQDGRACDHDGFGCAEPARALAERHAATAVRVVSTACASGNAALGTALGWLRAGTCDAVLCGGVDALQEFVLSGFVSLRAHAPSPCRPFDAARCGLNLGEGAAFLLVETEAHARARGARARARLDGYGLSCDAHHMTGPDRAGRGAARAMLAALADAGLPREQIGFVSAHGTATVFNDLMEAHGLGIVLGEAADSVPVNSIKGALGHTLGAAGALEAVMAVRALEAQVVPPTAGHAQRDPEIPLHVVAGEPLPGPLQAVLSTSSGFGGVNAATVFCRGPASGAAQ